MPEVIFGHTFARFTRAIGEIVRLVIAIGALLERQRWLIGRETVLEPLLVLTLGCASPE
jgi:hypothetical protein